eukprot:12642249-Alexandrium_andersonii.AAC.1
MRSRKGIKPFAQATQGIIAIRFASLRDLVLVGLAQVPTQVLPENGVQVARSSWLARIRHGGQVEGPRQRKQDELQ